MNKKIFVIRVGTYLLVLLCLVIAVTVWLAVKMIPSQAEAFNLVRRLRWR